jgi:hypothetical protein
MEAEPDKLDIHRTNADAGHVNMSRSHVRHSGGPELNRTRVTKVTFVTEIGNWIGIIT